MREYPFTEVGLTEAVRAVVDPVFTEGVNALPHGLEGTLARDAFKVDVDV